jgi:hypothetical protein
MVYSCVLCCLQVTLYVLGHIYAGSLSHTVCCIAEVIMCRELFVMFSEFISFMDFFQHIYWNLTYCNTLHFKDRISLQLQACFFQNKRSYIIIIYVLNSYRLKKKKISEYNIFQEQFKNDVSGSYTTHQMQ